MLLYHTNSWHYRLVLYVFTKEFFLDTRIDHKAMSNQALDHLKNNSDFKNFDHELIYKKKTKTINFCPYCRAVVAAIASAPFVYLWRLYPHKPKPKKTHEEVMKNMRRRSKIVKIVFGTTNIITGIINIALGIGQGMDHYGVFIFGIFQLVLVAIWFTGHLWADKVIKWIVLDRHEIRQKFRMRFLKLVSAFTPKWMKRTKPREPSKIMQKIKSTHDVYCPPIFFVEDINQEKLK